MDWLLDTNLLLRFSDPVAALHYKACNALETLFNRGELLHLTAQNLVEFWAVATRPVAANGFGWTCGVTDTRVSELIQQFLFIEDSSAIFQEWRTLVSGLNVHGKKVHDARLVAVMNVHRIARLLTFNTADFQNFSTVQAVHPDEVIAGRA